MRFWGVQRVRSGGLCVPCLGFAYSQNLKQDAASHVSKFLFRVSLVTTSSLLLAHHGFYLITSAKGNGHLAANRFVANRSIIAGELSPLECMGCGNCT